MFVDEFKLLTEGDVLFTIRGGILKYRDDMHDHELCLTWSYVIVREHLLHLLDDDVIIFVRHVPCSELTTFIGVYDGMLVVCHRAWIKERLC